MMTCCFMRVVDFMWLWSTMVGLLLDLSKFVFLITRNLHIYYCHKIVYWPELFSWRCHIIFFTNVYVNSPNFVLYYRMKLILFSLYFSISCLNDFNNAVVITNRPLKPGEIFEVLLEQVVMKWAGTIEIGVTMHSAIELNFPSTMTNVRSGTWMMTGNGIMYNGTTISEEYGFGLGKLKVSLFYSLNNRKNLIAKIFFM